MHKQGWYEDPAGFHEYRWFSGGVPTDLVIDGHQTSHDPISISDPAVYEAMDLAEAPDDGAVLIQSGTSFPAEVQVVDYGMGPGAGPVATMGAAPGTWSRAAGWKEILLIFAPIVAAIALQAPDGIVLLSFVVAVVIAALGAARRRRLARRARH